MAHRSFTDVEGRSWEVWEVRPGMAILGDASDRRRAGSDRRAAVATPRAGDTRVGPEPASSGHAERRVRRERRVGVAAPLRGGWLAFRAGDERRRLAPIPQGWERETELQLAAYCRAARPVSGAARSPSAGRE